jgi:tRNA(fMet)-specific endonuclease VapC
MKYLLDTNIVSAIATAKSPNAIERLRATQRADVATSEVVWHEVQFGLAKHGGAATRLAKIYAALFDDIAVLPVTRAVWAKAVEVRASLSARGTPIGPYDLLIAATALEHGMIVVTRNVGEFGRVEGLRVENWV